MHVDIYVVLTTPTATRTPRPEVPVCEPVIVAPCVLPTATATPDYGTGKDSMAIGNTPTPYYGGYPGYPSSRSSSGP